MEAQLFSRSAGVLLHPTSLPNKVLDQHAWRFLDWMKKSGLSVWQMLPLTPPVEGISPYHSDSAFAMNPSLLPSDWESEVDGSAFEAYKENAPEWLQDYALFKVLKTKFDQQPWSSWPEVYRFRCAETLTNFSNEQHEALSFYKKEQFAISELWKRFKKDANEMGILLFGDMPIFVVYDSVEVWANPKSFKLDENLNPSVVTGVPPDYFAEHGQRWGNPHYDWDEMASSGFKWWIERFRSALSKFDVVRIDHFRGFEAVWEIDAEEETAINGRWVSSPGAQLLDKIQSTFPKLPLVAEDLGFITQEVRALKDQYSLPGMSVLQFGFDGHGDNPHALRNQVGNSVVYTGTHDNDTTLGWYDSLDEHTQHVVKETLSHIPEDHISWAVIQAALLSPAVWAIIPMQDFLGLDTNSRMNVPGTIENNWLWQFQWDALTEEITDKLSKLIKDTHRNT